MMQRVSFLKKIDGVDKNGIPTKTVVLKFYLNKTVFVNSVDFTRFFCMETGLVSQKGKL